MPDEPDGDDDSFTFTKQPSIIEYKAYRDIWGHGLESYLQWFYETVLFLHQLLHQNGSLYVHLDWHVAHYAKCVLDEVFGSDHFANEIVWRRTTPKGLAFTRFASNHDVIFYYHKTENYVWNPQHVPHSSEYLDRYNLVDPTTGRRFQATSLLNPNRDRPNLTYEFHGHTKVWRWKKERMLRAEAEGRIYFPPNGGVPREKRFLDEQEGVPVSSVWTDIAPVNAVAQERLRFPTQKPEALLERIIRASSEENDLVLDCFCGSGTTAAAAEKLGRQWIACDLGRFAIHTTRKRLLSIRSVRPFMVQNLGKYERQQWAGAEFGDNRAAVRQRAYTEFILKLAGAAPLHGYTWLHGLKAGRMVHVGAVDAPVSVGDVTQIAAEFRRAVGTGKDAPTTNGVDVLGWDFAFELNEVAKQQAAAANIQMRFLRIPRDVMDKRAAEQGDIRFFELAALSVEVKADKRNVFLKLTDFVIPPDDVPEEARKAVKHWSQWIDYWAADWDNKGDAFHNEWQTYRTRKGRSLLLETVHNYGDPGEYTVVVKVIDILGNDTTKTVKVRVL